jgi:hypothetical protein
VNGAGAVTGRCPVTDHDERTGPEGVYEVHMAMRDDDLPMQPGCADGEPDVGLG